MDKSPKGSKPGLLYVASKVVDPSLSEVAFFDWYENIHIPDIFKSGGASKATRWFALDPKSAKRPNLLTYPVEDTDFFTSDAFRAIPNDSKTLPGSGHIFDLANFDVRFYKQVQLYEPEDPKAESPTLLLCCGFTPADDEDYDNWYRREHLKEDVSQISTWRKSERYELLNGFSNSKTLYEEEYKQPPKFLTLHYFDGETLPEEELKKAGESEWTKKNMSTMKEIQVTPFKLRRTFQDHPGKA